MIRLRDTDSKTSVVEDRFRFVEICDSNGKLGGLVFIDDANVVHVATSKDPELRKYAKMFSVPMAPIIEP